MQRTVAFASLGSFTIGRRPALGPKERPLKIEPRDKMRRGGLGSVPGALPIIGFLPDADRSPKDHLPLDERLKCCLSFQKCRRFRMSGIVRNRLS